VEKQLIKRKQEKPFTLAPSTLGHYFHLCCDRFLSFRCCGVDKVQWFFKVTTLPSLSATKETHAHFVHFVRLTLPISSIRKIRQTEMRQSIVGNLLIVKRACGSSSLINNKNT
jgi:hypothetical protein